MSTQEKKLNNEKTEHIQLFRNKKNELMIENLKTTLLKKSIKR